MHYIRSYDDDEEDNYRDSYNDDYRNNDGKGRNQYYDDKYYTKVLEPPETKKGAEDVIQEVKKDKSSGTIINLIIVRNSKEL